MRFLCLSCEHDYLPEFWCERTHVVQAGRFTQYEHLVLLHRLCSLSLVKMCGLYWWKKPAHVSKTWETTLSGSATIVILRANPEDRTRDAAVKGQCCVN